MATKKGFSIEVSSRYDGWWRYNAALMCGMFDADGNRTGFASASSHVADVGSGLAEPPAGVDPARRAVLETPECDHLVLYIYIIPHKLPDDNDIEATKPFEIEIAVHRDGRELFVRKHAINQWSGASFEIRIGREGEEGA